MNDTRRTINVYHQDELVLTYSMPDQLLTPDYCARVEEKLAAHMGVPRDEIGSFVSLGMVPADEAPDIAAAANAYLQGLVQ